MNNNFAENLKRIRKENNMSQEELAELLGVSRQAISKWESRVAYPEMDKIMAICTKFNINIDDLLHKDIEEVKNEEEVKKNLNYYMHDFLEFITETIDLFCNMSFINKIKLIIEEVVLIAVLLFVDILITSGAFYLFENILSLVYYRVLHILVDILCGIIFIVLLIFTIIILVKVFKRRYLDYYHGFKNNTTENEVNNEGKEKFNLKESKIIIRDPKNSEYHFINTLIKVIVGCLKCFSMVILILLGFILIFLLFLLVISCLLYKTGFFFVGLLGIIIASSIILITLLVIILNFVFNLKNNKKTIIYTLVGSIITLGLSSGLTFIGSLDFEVLEVPSDMYVIREKEFLMQDNLSFASYENPIEYIESDISNVKIEYKTYKYWQIDYDFTDNSHIELYSECHNYFKMLKDYISKLNDKKILISNNEEVPIRIYANKENIIKLQDNYNKYQKGL